VGESGDLQHFRPSFCTFSNKTALISQKMIIFAVVKSIKRNER